MGIHHKGFYPVFMGCCNKGSGADVDGLEVNARSLLEPRGYSPLTVAGLSTTQHESAI